MKSVTIGSREVGPGFPCYIIAEIGINHNGDMEIAKALIRAAHEAQCDAVKFQKRTVDVVYSQEELARPRESPFGATNGDLKRGLEFGRAEYEEIDAFCKILGIDWFASCWDEASVDFIADFNPVCYKIASASLTDDKLLRYHRSKGRPIILSTGMSTMQEIEHAVGILGPDDLILLHTNSSYPSRIEDLNMRVILTLQQHFCLPTGYSGHEVGLAPSMIIPALDACCIERHITLDRAMWGSDQAASVEPVGFARLVRSIRTIEIAMGDGVKCVYKEEESIKAKLRRVG